MRLFVALEIPSGVRAKFAELIQELSAIDSDSSKRVRWVKAENLHVTLKFIGHVDEEKAAAIREALARVPSGNGVELVFRGLGFFPNEKRARVLWGGVQASSNLAQLAGELDARLEKLGIARETREFAPHLTLARLDPPGIPEKLRNAVEAKRSREFGSACSADFHLFESKTRPGGAEYTRLASFRFASVEG